MGWSGMKHGLPKLEADDYRLIHCVAFEDGLSFKLHLTVRNVLHVSYEDQTVILCVCGRGGNGYL
jgi:hypothetical protein